MATKLWDYYGGEPFMENPHLAVIGANPFKVGSIIERKKQGFRKISERKGSKVMAYKRRGKKNSPKRKRRARRNPFPGGGLMINRPRRRRRNSPKVYHMKKNRRGTYVHNRRRRRGARRNPAFLGVALPPMNMILWGTGGFIGTPMIERFLVPFLPAEITTNVLGRYAVKIGSLLGLTYLVKAVMSPREAFPIALGGTLYVVTSAINEFLPQLTAPAPAPAPTTGVQAYRSGMIKAYRSGMIATGIGNGYAATNLARPLPGLAQPSQMMPRFDIDSSGMKNPVFADPRFVNSPQVAR